MAGTVPIDLSIRSPTPPAAAQRYPRAPGQVSEVISSTTYLHRTKAPRPHHPPPSDVEVEVRYPSLVKKRRPPCTVHIVATVILTCVVAAHIWATLGSSAPPPVLPPEEQQQMLRIPFTLVPDPESAGKWMDVSLRLMDASLVPSHYEICCSIHGSTFVCRSATKSLAIEAYILLATRVARVQIMHPDMVGSLCSLNVKFGEPPGVP